MRTEQIKLYEFDELKPQIQEEVIEKNRYINVEGFEWWEFCYEQFKEELQSIGVSCENFYFSIDRDRHIYMENPSIENEEKFLNSALNKNEQILKELEEQENEYYINIETQHLGYGYAKNEVIIAIEDKEGNEVEIEKTPYANVDFTEYLNDILKDFLKRLEDEYLFLMSDEQVKESLIANGYEFTEKGEFF